MRCDLLSSRQAEHQEIMSLRAIYPAATSTTYTATGTRFVAMILPSDSFDGITSMPPLTIPARLPQQQQPQFKSDDESVPHLRAVQQGRITGPHQARSNYRQPGQHPGADVPAQECTGQQHEQ